MPEGKVYPKCFDAYLLYAIWTGFEYFSFFNETKFKLFLLTEFKKAGQADDFAEKMNRALSERAVDLGPADDNTPYSTIRTRTMAVTAAVSGSAVFDLWEEYVSRVELSLPLKLSVEEFDAAKKKKLRERRSEGRQSAPTILLGMLDDGCPFAAAHFLETSSRAAVSTRVRGIWDQNRDKKPIDVYDSNHQLCRFGLKPRDFKYGIEFRRDFAASAEIDVDGRRLVGLDEWIRLHSSLTGSIDEDGCYADAKFTNLSSRQSHGAHVMDVLAGQVPVSSRIGPSRPGQDRRDPPSWKLGTDPASSADVVFVQFPEACIRDATGVWLKAYVVDGIRYILSFADPARTEHAVINLSYGPTTGPHDGTAELEAALSALVAEYNGKIRKPKLEIVLAAGNAYLSEGHVVFTSDDEQPEHVEWTWRLPPDNTVLCFAEVWMDDADAAGVTVTLTSPSRSFTQTSPVLPTDFTLPTPGGNIPQVIGPIVWGKDRMWLLEVGPTIAAPGIMANEHGDWTIKVDGISENAQVHAYVARSDPNMGVRTGAKRSYFVDSDWEQTRSAAASCTRVDGDFDKSGSLIHRDGTLNGIATAKKRRVHVAGGYVLADRRKSSYSSQGPSRRGPRDGPDFALPCDESYALGGIRAGGNRSGAVFRLTGTSAGAPQLGRQIVKLVSGMPFPAPTDVPSPNDLVEIEKRGSGNLEPP
jgi:hypothetical protein